MDALEFLREWKRMCTAYIDCCDKDYKRIINTIEQWSKEHPRNTRQSEFLEQWPEAEIDVNGVIQLCPMSISATHRDNNGECKNPEKLCRDCRKEFWMQEVE